METKKSKGFTLVELLIVIGILAVLATITVVVLNPAQLFAQARDSQRLNDLSAIVSAVNYYTANVATPTFTVGPFSTSNTACGWGASACTVNNTYAIDGTGWVGVAFNAVTPSPIATLPQDPTNNATYQYAYKGDNVNKVFKLEARLESIQYRGKMATDGGTLNTCVTYTESTCYYEVGTSLSL